MGLEYKRWRPAFEDNRVLRQLNIITRELKEIKHMAKTEADIIAEQQVQLDTIAKIQTETRSLIDKVKELLDMLANGVVGSDLENKTAEVSAQLKVADDLVPDETVKP